jgi:hypothetical protein
VTWTGEVFHCVCMTTDGLSPMRRMRLPFICGQLVDECVIGGQYGRVLWGRRAVRVHHRAMDFENPTAERGVKTPRAGQRSRECGDALDDARPLAGSRTRWTFWGSVGSVTNHPAPGRDVTRPSHFSIAIAVVTALRATPCRAWRALALGSWMPGP